MRNYRNKSKQLDVNVDCRIAARANHNDNHPVIIRDYLVIVIYKIHPESLIRIKRRARSVAFLMII